MAHQSLSLFGNYSGNVFRRMLSNMVNKDIGCKNRVSASSPQCGAFRTLRAHNEPPLHVVSGKSICIDARDRRHGASTAGDPVIMLLLHDEILGPVLNPN
jgi:hypothetical protein